MIVIGGTIGTMVGIFTFTYFKDKRVYNSDNHAARKYFEGITENLKRIVSLYPSDWNMRLYIDERGINDMTSICYDVCKMKKGRKYLYNNLFDLTLNKITQHNQIIQ